ncbi:hypothetical protein HY990_06490 [Candidatus Micrarchaeota archaeon]|nr:hypothetical protein [Candidatus Micrarchaeota archaeon]
MRAFIFSLDAFIAFSLALIAIYSLIFFSSIPTSYYYLLTQGHYLSRDTLLALSSTPCTTAFSECGSYSGSVLDKIALNDISSPSLVRNTIGRMVPNQFGYTVELSESGGRSWNRVYSTSETISLSAPELHAPVKKKLSVSSQVISFGYSGRLAKAAPNPFSYLSCHGASGVGLGDGNLITCSLNLNNPPGSGGSSVGGDLVPTPYVRLVRLTIFI